MPNTDEELANQLNDNSPAAFLPELIKRYSAWKSTGEKPDADELMSYYNSFILRIDTKQDYAKPGYKEAAALMFPIVCLAVLEHSYRMLPMIVPAMAKILLDDTCMQKVLRESQGKEMLAWFVCAHAPVFKRSTQPDAQENFKVLLEKITGKLVSPRASPSIELAVTTLYGSACWDLYGHDAVGATDAETAVMIARELHKASLPLIYKTQVNNTRDVNATVLPDGLL